MRGVFALPTEISFVGSLGRLQLSSSCPYSSSPLLENISIGTIELTQTVINGIDDEGSNSAVVEAVINRPATARAICEVCVISPDSRRLVVSSVTAAWEDDACRHGMAPFGRLFCSTLRRDHQHFTIAVRSFRKQSLLETAFRHPCAAILWWRRGCGRRGPLLRTVASSPVWPKKRLRAAQMLRESYSLLRRYDYYRSGEYFPGIRALTSWCY